MPALLKIRFSLQELRDRVEPVCSQDIVQQIDQNIIAVAGLYAKQIYREGE